MRARHSFTIERCIICEGTHVVPKGGFYVSIDGNAVYGECLMKALDEVYVEQMRNIFDESKITRDELVEAIKAIVDVKKVTEDVEWGRVFGAIDSAMNKLSTDPFAQTYALRIVALLMRLRVLITDLHQTGRSFEVSG